MTSFEAPRTRTANMIILAGLALLLALQGFAKAGEIDATANQSTPVQSQPAESYSPPQSPC